MRPGDVILAQNIQGTLSAFAHNMPGIQNAQQMDCLIKQIIDSVRRIKFITTIRTKHMGSIYTDASSIFFDPLKAAVWYIQNGDINEAFWLVFLATHFGKNKTTKWELVRNTYGALGGPTNWDWQRTASNFNAFRTWLAANQTQLKATGSVGNHRKYQSLDAYKRAGTGEAVGSYIDWVGPAQDHLILIQNLQAYSHNNPRLLFRLFYNSMKRSVRSFDRLACFDYLTMVGKLGLAPIIPDSAYMTGATGAKDGARLLFGGNKNASITKSQLDTLLGTLESQLSLHFGMQVLEDALCNWQKSPNTYIYFNG